MKNESSGSRIKTLSVEEYVDKIRPYLKDIINNLKKSDTCKIQLAIVKNFISSIYNDDVMMCNAFRNWEHRNHD